MVAEVTMIRTPKVVVSPRESRRGLLTVKEWLRPHRRRMTRAELKAALAAGASTVNAKAEANTMKLIGRTEI